MFEQQNVLRVVKNDADHRNGKARLRQTHQKAPHFLRHSSPAPTYQLIFQENFSATASVKIIEKLSKFYNFGLFGKSLFFVYNY
jgi:hypothetical protein